MAGWVGLRNCLTSRRRARSSEDETMPLPSLSFRCAMIPRLIAFAILPILCSAAFAQDTRILSGEVTYRERIALPPDAVLMVEVTAIDRSMIAEARIATEDRQVPIPFEIDVPGDTAGTLRAGLSTGGRVDWLSDPVEVDAGMSGDIGELVLHRFQPMGFVSAFRCGDRMIRVGFAGESAVLDTGSERLVLEPSRAASGARYEAEGDPDTWFWNQGDSALVSLAGRSEEHTSELQSLRRISYAVFCLKKKKKEKKKPKPDTTKHKIKKKTK